MSIHIREKICNEPIESGQDGGYDDHGNFVGTVAVLRNGITMSMRRTVWGS